MNYQVFLICLIVIEALLLAFCSYQIFKKKKVLNKSNIFYFLPLFVLIYIIYIIPLIYTQATPDMFISRISASLKSFVFEISWNETLTLFAKEFPLYITTFYICYSFCAYATISTFVAFIEQSLTNRIRLVKTINNDTDIIFNYSSKTITYLKNSKNLSKSNVIIWLSPENKTLLRKVYEQGYAYICKDFNEKNINKFFSKHHRYNFINFKEDKNKISNIKLLTNLKKDISSTLNLYVEVEYDELASFNNELRNYKLENKNNNVCIQCFSLYELLSRDFIIKHPFSKYITKDFYNDNLTIKDNKEINVFLLGYGKVNKDLCALLIENNQFASLLNNKLISKKINYYIYDIDNHKIQDKLNCIFNLDYEANYSFKKPANITFFNEDVYSINTLNKNIKLANDPNSFNFFFVSLDKDTENDDIAKAIKKRCKDNSIFFVRSKEKKFITSDNFIHYGNINELISHDVIVFDSLNLFSYNVNSLYNEINRQNLQKERKWQLIPYIEKYSNIYASCNVRFKLNLLGLDYGYNEKKKELSKEEYLEIYLSDNNNMHGTFTYDEYDEYFKISKRNVLAFLEHQRWTTFYILNNYSLMDNSKIKIKDDHKGYVVKDIENVLHACLVDYYDLDKLYKYLESDSTKNSYNLSLKDIESYRYDFMIMDSLYDQLAAVGYKIYKK